MVPVSRSFMLRKPKANCAVTCCTIPIVQRAALDPAMLGRRLVFHDRPHYEPPTDRRARAWDKRYAAVFRSVAEQGRFPRQLGGPHERAMQRWLYNQRRELEAGELDEGPEELLDALAEWR